MTRDERCRLCEDTLSLACELWAEEGWCALRERYLSGEMSGDDVLYEVRRRLSPDRVELLRKRLADRGWTT